MSLLRYNCSYELRLTLLSVHDLFHEPKIHIVFLIEIDVIVDRKELIDAMFGLGYIFDLIDVDSLYHQYAILFCRNVI